MHLKQLAVTYFVLAMSLGGVGQGMLAATAVPSAAGQEAKQSVPAIPSRIYDRVWELIEATYYDPTHNDQSWQRWRHKYEDKLKTREDAYKAIETMLASLGDRYTRFLEPEAFKEENEQIAARLYGIGIQMGYNKNHRIIVIAPIENTPAARAGLMPLDEIVAVNGKSTNAVPIEAVSRMIRGAIGTEVVLTIQRNKESRIFRIKRGEIPIKSVQKVTMLNSDIGYVKLGTFISQNANREMRDALTQLTPARGIILDLRDNPGGLVTNAVDISNIFLFGGVIVSTLDRNSNKVSTMSVGTPFSKQPLVVLINHGSASASEITSGALRDNGRAELVGQKSFGKGLVQAINRLEDGSGINITVARYLTPNGTDINKKGIVPDYEIDLAANDYKQGKGPWWQDPAGPAVKRSPEDLKDVQLRKAVEVLESKISNVPARYEIKLEFPGFGPSGLGLQGSN